MTTAVYLPCPEYQRRVTDREGRKTIAEELDHKARRDFRFTEADLDPTIIEVQVLERGQYFVSFQGDLFLLVSWSTSRHSAFGSKGSVFEPWLRWSAFNLQERLETHISLINY
ncbi:hypothetical protein ElyMa_002839800 [Elysia marginata]|uniref:Uncharacterized protein n=1 Tax=Elysia marginata TaxID=1093978 RepID=A0AAV4HTM5_9GAST|nr:hypothetical protein ElyMa_002839800 [Elysia marginata]